MLILKGVLLGLGLFVALFVIAWVLLRGAAVSVDTIKSFGMLAIGCGMGSSRVGA